MAGTGLVASLLGRALAPALFGAGQGLDRIIDWVDLVAGFATFAFGLLALTTTSLQLVHTLREGRLGLAYRIPAILLGGLIVALVTPAMPLRLPELGLVITGTASALLAVLASRPGLRAPRTRALGFVLAATGLAALCHMTALVLSVSPLPSMLLLSRALSTVTVAIDGTAVLVAFTWLATRAQGRVSWPTLVALSLATIVFWGARQGTLDSAALWQVVAHRGVTQLTVSPPSFVLPEVRQMLELSALALAGASLFVRRQVPSVTASLSLILLARTTTDVPLSAVALSLAALTTAMEAAVGERSPSPRP